jgi:threonine aldolase
MYSFLCDYSEGAHPRILEALTQTNLEQNDGYGLDAHCRNAAAFLKGKIGREDIDIHFLVGGTQTNFTAISAFLRAHEAVIAANTGHIFVHETGAVEATGHKVLTCDSSDGKLRPEDIQDILTRHEDEHMVKPQLVYISNSTEIGSIYHKSEVIRLSEICRENGLFLFMDGARLGSALTSAGNDLCLSDLAEYTDAFYIGGTKNGAFMGEALVICRESLKADFRYHIKQKGGLLAKGRLLGIQFEELFRDDLYFELAAHANQMAGMLTSTFAELGFPFLTDSPSNQIFPILPDELICKLEEDYSFYRWKRMDEDHTAIRLVTSWATEEAAILRFIGQLKQYIG